jgi:hypothetical protein
LLSVRTFLHSKQPADRFGIFRQCAGRQPHEPHNLGSDRRQAVERFDCGIRVMGIVTGGMLEV